MNLSYFFRLLIVGFALSLFYACDKVSQDTAPLRIEETDEALGVNLLDANLIYTSGNEPVILDLLEISTLTGASNYSILNKPNSGKVEFVGSTLLGYFPDSTKNVTEDLFVISGKTLDNKIKKDTIQIKLMNSVSDIPCNAGALADEYTVIKNKSLTMNVLANDMFCNVEIDSLNINVSLKPKLGKVEVVKGRIVYTPNTDAKGKDSFIYKVCATGKNPKCRYALVSIDIVEVMAVCKTYLIADAFLWTRLVGAKETTLDVLRNDKLCDVYKPGKLTISSKPIFGEAIITTDNKVSYVAGNDLKLLDGFEYQLCDNTGKNCLKSYVLLTVYTPPPCKTTIREDAVVVSLAKLPSNGEIEIPILANDKICEEIMGLKVSKVPKYGSVRIDNKKLYFKPKAGQIGTDAFSYEVLTSTVNVQYVGEVSVKTIK